MRRIRAGGQLPISLGASLTRQPLEVAHQQPIHGRGIEGGLRQCLAAGVLLWPEERAIREPGPAVVIVNRISGGEVKANGSPAGRFLGEADGGPVGILAEVVDAEAAPGSEAGDRIEIELEDGPVAVIEDGITGGQAHELAGAGVRACPSFLATVGGLTAEELGIGRVGRLDGQPELGRGGLEVFEERAQGADPPVEGLRRGPVGNELIASGVHDGHRGLQ